MKILLISGHGAGDSGALGNGDQEQRIVREIAPRVRDYIGNRAEVVIYPTDRNAYYDMQNGYLVPYIQNGGFDYVLEIHLNSNAGKPGQGTEIFITTSEQYATVELEIMNGLGTLYPPTRGGNGVKVMDWGVIRTCKNVGVSAALLETYFINNPDEYGRWNAEKEKTAKLIADGVIKGFELGEVTPIQPEKPQPPTSGPDQILNPGDKFKFAPCMQVTARNQINGVWAVYFPDLRAWVAVEMVTETNAHGTPTGDQFFEDSGIVGLQYGTIEGVFTAGEYVGGNSIMVQEFGFPMDATTMTEV